MTIGTQAVENLGLATLYSNTSTDDNEAVITTADVSRYSTFEILCLTGAVDVYVSLDGTNFSTDPISLVDQGATDSAPVIVTAAGRLFGFRGVFRKVKLLQNGGTDVAASLLCGNLP